MRLDVLLVEDSSGDVRLTQEAFRGYDSKAKLHVVSDGVEAMAFLRREAPFVDAPRPALILLDLNLPGLDGREVLAQIKGDPKLRMIPIIILSTSDAETDVMASYELHANCYIGKPAQWDAFESLMRNTMDFWLQRIRLPQGSTVDATGS